MHSGSLSWTGAMMRISIPALALLAVVSSPAAAAEAGGATYYVATGGNDQWSGTLAEPNADKSDGPLATLEAARDAIRQRKRAGGLPAGGVTVAVRGGTYSIAKPLELASQDSGTEAAPIVYRAQPGEVVRLAGGPLVGDWRPVTDAQVLARLDEKARPHVVQADLRALGITDYGNVKGGGLELFFDDRPMTLARWPNEGFVKIVGLVGGSPRNVRGTKGDAIGKFIYEGDRPKRWVDEKDVWVHGYWFWDWADERHRVASIDTDRRIISVAPPYHRYGYRKGQWFYAFNLLSEIDRPGEWYLDREKGVLYFWPPGPVQEGRPTVSVLATMVTMRDTSYVTLRGMTIEATRGDAVTISGGTHDRVAGCTLRNLGGWAVRISGGTNHGVTGCDIYETGNGGIALGGGDRKTLTPAGHFAHNNHIHHFARWNRMYQPAISIQGVGNRATHNLIHDAPHEAIAFGGNDHLMEFNEIHHVCQESNDAGAIYAGRDWTMRGTIIRHNFMHHVRGFKNRGCVGVYLDDMFSGTTISGNVFYDVTRAAFIGGGRDCVVENNIFVDCKPALHVDARAMGWAAGSVPTTMKTRLDAMPTKGPLWSGRYPKLVGVWEDEPAAPKGNLIARNVSFGGRWDEVNATARPYLTLEDNLVDVDPHFVDAAKMDFRLPDDSPVYTKVPGFKKIPFEQIGLVRDEDRPTLPSE